MKKFILTLSICLLCLFAWNLSEASAITIEVDGVKLQSDTAPEIVNGRTFVPMRVIFEALDAEIVWEPETREILSHLRGMYLRIFIDNKIAYVNGNEVKLDEAAYISNGRTMVPVRFIGETFNYTVGWNDNTKTVTLNKYAAPVEINSKGEGISVIIDGKVSDLSKYVRTGINEFTKEEVVIMPLDRLVKQLNRYAEITYSGEDFVIATNNEIYEGNIGNNVLMPQLSPVYDGYSKYEELIDGEYYMDAEYVAIALKANSYIYDRINNTITIDTVNKNFDNTKHDIKASSVEEFTNKFTEWLLTTEDDRNDLKILFDFTLDKDTFKVVNHVKDNIIEKSLMDSHIISGLGFMYKDNQDGFINIETYIDETDKQEALKVNRKSKELVKKLINEGMRDQEKVKVLNNYIIENVEPEYEATGEGRVYGAMFRGKAVCVGYADMFISMAHLSGLEVKSVSGTIHGNKHRWAKVKIDGEWLHVDPTWNDDPNNSNQYLLKTDEEMRKTHRW